MRHRYVTVDPIDHGIAEQIRTTLLVLECDLRTFQTIIHPDRIQSDIGERRDQSGGLRAIAIVLIGGLSTEYMGDLGAKSVVAADFIATARIEPMFECRPDPVFPAF